VASSVARISCRQSRRSSANYSARCVCASCFTGAGSRGDAHVSGGADMKVVRLVIFSVALAAEILFVATLNFFDDWTLEPMPVFFVAAAFLSGMAYLVAVSVSKIEISLRTQAVLFWGAAIILRLIA